MLRQGTVNRVKAAVDRDPSIVVPVEQLATAKGNPTVYLKSLGLRLSDLKKLEIYGLAARGYSKNIWVEGEVLPNSKTVPKGSHFRGQGHQTLWIILSPKEEK